MNAPEWIAFLRERIAAAESRGAAEQNLCVTIIAPSVKGIGVRPRIVEWHANGDKTYVLTLAQARRALARAVLAVEGEEKER